MLGSQGEKGIAAMAFDTIFGLAEQEFEDFAVETTVALSVMEVYNERVHDLLSLSMVTPGASALTGEAENLNVRLDKSGAVYVENLTVHYPQTVLEAMALVTTAVGRRQTGDNNINDRSSRSHLILQTQVCLRA